MAKKMPKGLMNIKVAMEMSPKDMKSDMKNGGKETKIEAKEYVKVKKKAPPKMKNIKKKC